ncbi:MAG: hypothetical protein ACO3UU_11180, partial [Minisyncoccia bacterium]
ITGNRSSARAFVESLVTKVTEFVSKLYSLPNKIEIQFENMGPNVYGMTMLDPRFSSRIRLNQDLNYEELIYPLTHELFHLHQMHTCRLQSRSGGRILWETQIYKVATDKLSYREYLELPWEKDVTEKQHKLLDFLQQNAKKIKVKKP